MDEGAFHIRIGLPPHIVSGDCLASSFVFARACSMSDVHDLGVVLDTSYLSCDYVRGRPLAWYPVSHDRLCTILGRTIVLAV